MPLVQIRYTTMELLGSTKNEVSSYQIATTWQIIGNGTISGGSYGTINNPNSQCARSSLPLSLFLSLTGCRSLTSHIPPSRAPLDLNPHQSSLCSRVLGLIGQENIKFKGADFYLDKVKAINKYYLIKSKALHYLMKAKAFRQCKNMAPIDRISGLSDDVICLILSFLPIKLSVSTSILSRRWRFLWAKVPNLDFDGNNHHSKMRYWSIIDNVISPHNMQSITTFSLRLSFFHGPMEDEPELEKLLASAVERNVQNICLALDLLRRLPQSFLTCRTLVDLSLGNIKGLHIEVVVYFPSLKVLHLGCIEYETSEALPNFLSGCPVLEELTVCIIKDYDLDCCYISSPTIKKLEIDFPYGDGDEYNLYDEVKIDAPALEYFNVFDCSYDHITLSPLTSLIEANIYFDNDTLQVDYYFYTRCVLKFIDALRNVKCLKLSGGSKEFLELGVARPRVRFDNLIRLELTVDWRFIRKFLESANNLEELIIYEVDEELKIWMEPIEKQHACLLFSLRTVTIDQFGCTEQELNLVRYLLSNARVLKKIEIYYKPDGLSLEEKFYAFNKISSFHQGSAGCEIVWAEASFQQEPEEFE